MVNDIFKHKLLKRKLYCKFDDDKEGIKDSCNTVDEPLTWNMFSSML